MDSALELEPLDVPALLRSHHLSPKKGLGQNFLIDPSALKKLVAAADLPAEACVLEIGAGLGSLTRYLARSAGRVVAVELDQHLIPILEQVLAQEKNVRILRGDILALNLATLDLSPGYLVVANIPYYITSAILRHLLEAPVKPSRLVLTVQREVAERICAAPGDHSLLSLSVQVYGAPRPVLKIPAGAFYPPPQVDSTTLRVDIYPQPRIPAEQLDAFFRLAKAGFSQKRKTLRNALSAGLALKPAQTALLLEKSAIDPMRRAETLSLEEWSRLIVEFLEEKNVGKAA